MNKLYFGDNLRILREHIADESVDLIYLDPPFNSKRDYSVLFKTPKGHESDAQITAFEDSWHWGAQAEREYSELLHQPNTDVSKMVIALQDFLGKNDMMAYLTMMANRLLELHRVLKPTGSLYLHCDPTASAYLKIILDGVFGPARFKNEITWKRTSAHNDPKKFGANADTILFYTKTNDYVWNTQYSAHAETYTARFRNEDSDGRKWADFDLTGAGQGPARSFNDKGSISPPSGRHWMYDQEGIDKLLTANKIYWTRTGMPRLKVYLDETEGVPLQAVWDDIFPVNSQAQERLGYPTQKPLALLERIIKASSNEGDVVLDPFCGCGTAVHAAQKLGRQWIGIDITHLAISLIEKRLRDAFPNIEFSVEGTPKDLDGARKLAELDKYEFQYWACTLVNAQPAQNKKKGADKGIDGLIFIHDDKSGAKKVLVNVKGGENVSVTMIRDFAHVIDREKAAIGLFVSLAEPTRPMREEAAALGFYDEPRFGTKFPKLQILTIEGLMSGTDRAEYPDLSLGQGTFKKARVEDVSGEQGELL